MLVIQEKLFIHRSAFKNIYCVGTMKKTGVVNICTNAQGSINKIHWNIALVLKVTRQHNEISIIFAFLNECKQVGTMGSLVATPGVNVCGQVGIVYPGGGRERRSGNIMNNSWKRRESACHSLPTQNGRQPGLFCTPI